MKKFFVSIFDNYKVRKCIWHSNYYLLVIAIVLSILPFTMFRHGYEVQIFTVVNISIFLFLTTITIYLMTKFMNGTKSRDNRTIFINRVLYFKFKVIRFIIYSILLFIVSINVAYGLDIRKCELISAFTIFALLFFPIIYIFAAKVRSYYKYKIAEVRIDLGININELEKEYDIRVDDIIGYELDKYVELKGNCNSSFNKELTKKVLLEIEEIKAHNNGRTKNKRN